MNKKITEKEKSGEKWQQNKRKKRYEKATIRGQKRLTVKTGMKKKEIKTKNDKNRLRNWRKKADKRGDKKGTNKRESNKLRR